MSLIRQMIDNMKLGVRTKPRKTLVYLTAPETTTSGMPLRVPWDAADDEVGAWDIANPSRVTVPNGATSMVIQMHLEWPKNGVGMRNMRLFRNNTQIPVHDADPYYQVSQVAQNATAAITHHMTATSGNMGCVAGDYFEMSVKQDSGLPLDLNVSASFMAFDWYYD